MNEAYNDWSVNDDLWKNLDSTVISVHLIFGITYTVEYWNMDGLAILKQYDLFFQTLSSSFGW